MTGEREWFTCSGGQGFLVLHPLRRSLWEVLTVSHKRRMSTLDDATKVIFVVVLAVTLLLFWAAVQLLSSWFPQT